MRFTLSSPHACTAVDDDALAAWHADGALKVTGLAPPEWVEHTRGRVAGILGAPPEDPAAWDGLRSQSLKPLGKESACVPVDTAPVKAAIDALLDGEWSRPKSGGNWFCNPPTHTDLRGLDLLPRRLWHWDDRPDLHPAGGLWAFSPLTELPAGSGGTWMVAGSHRHVLEFYDRLPEEKRGKPTKQAKKWFAAEYPYFAALNGDAPLELDSDSADGDAVKLVDVSGAPGDVVFMQDFVVHSKPDVIGPGPRVCHMITVAPAP